jgi:hypothetical protein
MRWVFLTFSFNNNPLLQSPKIHLEKADAKLVWMSTSLKLEKAQKPAPNWRPLDSALHSNPQLFPKANQPSSARNTRVIQSES